MVMGKTRFEQLCWNLAGVMVKNFHSNNGVYDARSFVTTAFQKTNPKPFLVLEQSIKMQLRNAIFKRYATGPAI